MTDPRTEEEAALAGHYFGSRWCAKLRINDEGYETEAVEWAIVWWRYHRQSTDIWTFIKRRLADLCRREGVYWVDCPTNQQLAAGEELGGWWDGNVLKGVRSTPGSKRDRKRLAILRGWDDDLALNVRPRFTHETIPLGQSAEHGWRPWQSQTETPDMEKALSGLVAKDEIREATSNLGRREEFVILALKQGYKPIEIATMLGVKPSWVSRRLDALRDRISVSD